MKTLTDLLAGVPPIPSWVPDVVAIIAIVLGVAAVLTTAWLIFKGIGALIRKAKTSKTAGEDLLTWAAAAIATGVSAQGMWRFAGDILGFDGLLRFLLFAFIEVAMFTSAVRAKKNMRENFSAGLDGIAVWVLTCLSAVLSCMDARSIPEGIFRLAAPLVAAWLWERGMAIERHRATGRKRINWRITPERVLVWFGLAETSDRTAGEVDARRRFDRVALAAKRVRALRDAGAKPWRIARAKARLERRYAAAHAHTGIGRDEGLQRSLAKEIASLYSAGALVDLEPASEWTPPAKPTDFGRLADETRDLKDSLAVRDEIRATWERIRAAEANMLMLASDKAGRNVADVTSAVTPGVTHAGVTNGVTRRVTEPPFFVPREWTSKAPAVTPPATPAVTPVVVAERVTFDVTDPAAYDVMKSLLGDPSVTEFVTPTVTPSVITGRVTNGVTKKITFKPKSGPDPQPKTAIMRAHWDKIRNEERRYPEVGELASVAAAHHSLASRRRAEWVKELPWRERRKASPKEPAVNGSK